MIKLINYVPFMISRMVIYISLPIFYLYLLYINTSSCVNRTCALCGMKTAIWNILHLRFSQAFTINPLSKIFVLISAIIIIDIAQMCLYVFKNLHGIKVC